MEFCPQRLTIARTLRRQSKAEIGRAIDVPPKKIAAFENGESEPTLIEIRKLADVLVFPSDFFYAHEIDMPSMDNASFRSRTSMTGKQRDSTFSGCALAIELADWLDRKLKLPTTDIVDMPGEMPEAAAAAIRGAWGLGERPIKNMIHLLESKGVRVFSLIDECKTVDAVSTWRGDTPFVFLNTTKSAERSRFDAAHELGHLVLHRHSTCTGGDRDPESEANAFASAFLMPRGSVLASIPNFFTLNTLVHMKRAWNVSVAALVRRLKDLTLLDQAYYDRLSREMGMRGYFVTEPNGIPRENSLLLANAFSLLREDGITMGAIAKELRISSNDLSAIVFGLVFTAVDGGKTTPV
ncbi:MAG: XRE family transcriptional regulator, partial [Polyangiaceae bacterium]|nr:XRE family transcriptional regulator [Polyangiaceae bacterium]